MYNDHAFDFSGSDLAFCGTWVPTADCMLLKGTAAESNSAASWGKKSLIELCFNVANVIWQVALLVTWKMEVEVEHYLELCILVYYYFVTGMLHLC